MYTVQAFGSSAGATCRLIMRGVATQEKYPVQLIIAEDTVSCGLTTLRLLTIAGLQTWIVVITETFHNHNSAADGFASHIRVSKVYFTGVTLF